MAHRAVSWYAKLMQRHPAKTQVVTTGILMLAGDVVCQKLVEKKQTVDAERAARFFIIGVGFVGPALRTWYLYLEKLVSPKGRMIPLKKMLLDQGAFAPIFLPCFLACLGVLQRQTWSEIKHKVKTDYIPVLTANYMLWPAAQMFNFYMVPLQYRVVYASGVAFLWNIYLSWKANRISARTDNETASV
ncbi:protein Mpv17-like [Ornithodoros turicata]|uniref:protein Mpv17-like n=1 Tax=Ornithodoros turicata TaxID=34597 RepID=UPI00313A3FEA